MKTGTFGRLFSSVAILAFFFVAGSTLADPGDLDSTFGADGIVTTDFFGNDDGATAIAVRPDGKIVVAGTVHLGPDESTADFAVARYLPDGTLDPAFGVGGKVTTDFTGSADFAHAVAIQEDGKIIVAGEATSGTQKSFALARYNSDGTVDTSFGIDGKVTTPFSDRDSRAWEIVVQPDQKIAVAGDSFHTTLPPPLPPADSDFALARYNSDGSLDQSFGSGGMVTTDFLSFSDRARALVRQPDGKLIAAGNTNTTAQGNGDFALARYNLDGALDTSFGSDGNGRVTTDFSGNSNSVQSMALQPDGSIVVAGLTFFGTPDNNHAFALVRYGADGNLDSTFGTGGKVTTDLNLHGDLAASVAVQADGKILAGGYANYDISGPDADLDLALVRYNPDGSLDPEFGDDGVVITNLTPGIETFAAITLQADGKLIGVGGAGPDFFVARYLTGVSGMTPQSVNMSTRASVGTDENVLIAGFIITGADSKKVILRALGPSLSLGDASVLADPVIELHAPDGTVTTNDNWRDAQELEIIDTNLPPDDDRESAIVATLEPGTYTAVLRGQDNGSGVGLVELYDLDGAASELANISSRGFVGTGDSVMIAGIIFAGENNATVVLRGLGPSLGQFGVADSLQDPTLDVYDANGTVTASNGNWRDLQEAALQSSNLAPADDREAALLVTLTAGAYTAILHGENGSEGIALIEVYRLAP